MVRINSSLYPSVVKQYQAGETTVSLAATYKVTEGTIRNVLRRQGVTARARNIRAKLAHQKAGRGAVLGKYKKLNGLYIPPQEWAALRSAHSDSDLAYLLCDAMKGEPVPWADIKENRAHRAFQQLKYTTLSNLLDEGEITLLRSPAAQQPDYHIKLKPPGNKASGYLFTKERWKTPKMDSPSVVQRWENDALRLRACRKFLRLKQCDEMTPALLRGALCVTGGTPAQFKPGAAKAVYELLRSEHVLDFSAGWGDRAVGFCAASNTKTYVGIDPNLALHPMYEQVKKMYGGTKRLCFIPECAEDVFLFPNSVDTVFSSPPYFGVEQYAQGTDHQSNQSWCRHPTPRQWKEGFLVPMLRKMWDALIPGGFLAVNIADVTVKGTRYPLCEWVQQTVSTFRDARFQFALGMRLQGANYEAQKFKCLSGEPIWIWSKGASRHILPTKKTPVRRLRFLCIVIIEASDEGGISTYFTNKKTPVRRLRFLCIVLVKAVKPVTPTGCLLNFP